MSHELHNIRIDGIMGRINHSSYVLALYLFQEEP